MRRMIFTIVAWAIWLTGMILTAECYDLKAWGIYLVGSMSYAGFVMLMKRR